MYKTEAQTQLVTVTVDSPCGSPTLSASSVALQTYVLTKTALVVSVPVFTIDPSYCPIAYSISDFTDGSDQTVDSEVISFDPDTRTIRVEYLDQVNFPAKERLNMVIKATGISGTAVESLTFELDVQNPCKVASKSISIWSDFSYNVFDVKQIRTWTDAIASSSENAALCGAWSFDLEMNDGSALLPTAFFKDIAGTEFSVESTDTSLAGAYKVKFFAWQGTYQEETAVASFTVTILQPCLSPTLTPSLLADQTYVLTKPSVQASFPAFTSDPAYCPITYTLTTQDDQAFDSSLISFTPASNQMTFEYLDTSTYSAKVGDYPLKVTGTAFTSSVSFSFTLSALDPCLEATL